MPHELGPYVLRRTDPPGSSFKTGRAFLNGKAQEAGVLLHVVDFVTVNDGPFVDPQLQQVGTRQYREGVGCADRQAHGAALPYRRGGALAEGCTIGWSDQGLVWRVGADWRRGRIRGCERAGGECSNRNEIYGLVGGVENIEVIVGEEAIRIVGREIDEELIRVDDADDATACNRSRSSVLMLDRDLDDLRERLIGAGVKAASLAGRVGIARRLIVQRDYPIVNGWVICRSLLAYRQDSPIRQITRGSGTLPADYLQIIGAVREHVQAVEYQQEAVGVGVPFLRAVDCIVVIGGFDHVVAGGTVADAGGSEENRIPRKAGTGRDQHLANERSNGLQGKRRIRAGKTGSGVLDLVVVH